MSSRLKLVITFLTAVIFVAASLAPSVDGVPGVPVLLASTAPTCPAAIYNGPVAIDYADQLPAGSLPGSPADYVPIRFIVHGVDLLSLTASQREAAFVRPTNTSWGYFGDNCLYLAMPPGTPSGVYTVRLVWPDGRGNETSFLFPSPTPTPQNTPYNPSFEVGSGKAPDGWQWCSRGHDCNWFSTGKWPNSMAHGGQRSAELTASFIQAFTGCGLNTQMIETTHFVPISQTAPITLSVWSRPVQESPTVDYSRFGAQIFAVFYTANSTIIGSRGVQEHGTFGQDGWRLTTSRISVGEIPSDAAKMRVLIRPWSLTPWGGTCTGTMSGRVLVDDVSLAFGEPTAGGAPDYFALGDSVAAGHGLKSYGPIGAPCLRSSSAYPHLVKKELERQSQSTVLFQHFACSGATAADATAVTNCEKENAGTPIASYCASKLLGQQVSDAIAALRNRPTVVSITIGANDFGWTDPVNLLWKLGVYDNLQFYEWADATVKRVRQALTFQIERLLLYPNVTVVVTEYHNPFNEQSRLFTAALFDRGSPLYDLLNPKPPIVPVFWSCRMNVERCYQRTEYTTQQLNLAFAGIQKGFPSDRVHVGHVYFGFKEHQSPRSICGASAPDIAGTWVQYPGDPESDAPLPAALRKLLEWPEGGDCFHPNRAGAACYAAAIIGTLQNVNGSCGTSGVTPAPTLSSISPPSAVAGGAGLSLSITGTNFASGATVRWNGGARSTTFESVSRMTAQIPAADIAAAGSASITVVNPDGQSSNAISFSVTAAPPSMQPMTLTGTATVNGTGPGRGVSWPVQARVGGTLCGSTMTSGASYTVRVDSATQRAGCGTNGVAVTFTVNGVAAQQTVAFSSGGSTTLNLNATGVSGGGGCAAPVLTAPADDVTLASRTVAFSWQPLSGCTYNGYTFRIKTVATMDSGGETVVDTGEGGTSRTETLGSQYDGRDLFWGVRAANAPDGAAWTVFRFRVQPVERPR